MESAGTSTRVSSRGREQPMMALSNLFTVSNSNAQHRIFTQLTPMLSASTIKSILSRSDGPVPRDFISIDIFEGVAVEPRTFMSMGKWKKFWDI